MGQLDVEIATYERLRDDLEANHRWEWAVVHGEELVGTFEDFQVAADTAVRPWTVSYPADRSAADCNTVPHN